MYCTDPAFISSTVFNKYGEAVGRYDAESGECVQLDTGKKPVSVDPAALIHFTNFVEIKISGGSKPVFSWLGPLTGRGAGAGGCSAETMRTPDGGINITPHIDAGPDSAIHYNPDAGVLVISDPFLFDDLGDRLQESGGEITVGPVNFDFSGAKDRIVKIIIESVPETLLPVLADQGVDGSIDITEIAERPDATNLGYNPGTGDATDYYIKNPLDPNNRLPVRIGTATLEDLTGKIADPITGDIGACIGADCVSTCDATDLATTCVDTVDATATESAQPFEYIVPPAAYNDNNGKVSLSFKLQTDPSGYTEGHQYYYTLRIRLVVE